MADSSGNPAPLSLDEAVELERRVWEALRTGDRSLDQSLLADDFVGVYPSGLSDRSGHVDQLVDGPTVLDYRLIDPLLIVIADDAVLLSYRADYLQPADPPGDGRWESMLVSSLWSRRDGAWVNTFSQDTPVDTDFSGP